MWRLSRTEDMFADLFTLIKGLYSDSAQRRREESNTEERQKKGHQDEGFFYQWFHNILMLQLTTGKPVLPIFIFIIFDIYSTTKCFFLYVIRLQSKKAVTVAAKEMEKLKEVAPLMKNVQSSGVRFSLF